MNSTWHKNISAPIKIQAFILIAFLVLMPLVMSFIAAEGICADSPIPDSLYVWRTILIFAGLAGAVLSFAILLRTYFKGQDDYAILHLSMTLCSFTIGWTFFPFWVNGIFQAYRGNGPDCTLSLYDPQYLIPVTSLGIFWYLPAVLIYPIGLLGGLILFILAMILLLKDRDWKEGIPALICLAIFASIIWGFPDCGTWLAD